MSEKETRVIRPQDTPNYENRNVAKPKTTSAKPASQPRPPKSKN